MANEDNRFRIEAAFGVPGQATWCYNAVRTSDNKPFLEGFVERKADGRYSMHVREYQGSKGLCGNANDHDSANIVVLAILRGRASRTIDESLLEEQAEAQEGATE